ncbi:MAG: hypothetical protein KAS07_01995 [Candidatus Pacebacteria bacterium]|nr:hypothetical protein [Candidatus Paceibacterota bacterium]
MKKALNIIAVVAIIVVVSVFFLIIYSLIYLLLCLLMHSPFLLGFLGVVILGAFFWVVFYDRITTWLRARKPQIDKKGEEGEEKSKKDEKEEKDIEVILKESGKIKSFFRGFLKTIFWTIVLFAAVLLIICISSWIYEKKTLQEEQPISEREKLLSNPDFAFARSIVKEKCVDGCEVDKIITIKAGEAEKLIRSSYTYSLHTDFISDEEVNILFRNNGNRRVVTEKVDPAKNHILCDLHGKIVGSGTIHGRPVDTKEDVNIVLLTFPIGYSLCK